MEGPLTSVALLLRVFDVGGELDEDVDACQCWIPDVCDLGTWKARPCSQSEVNGGPLRESLFQSPLAAEQHSCLQQDLWVFEVSQQDHNRFVGSIRVGMYPWFNDIASEGLDFIPWARQSLKVKRP